MFCTSVWCNQSEQAFRRAVPLHLLGESIRASGSSLSLTVVVLEGYERLSPLYIRTLENCGLEIIDYGGRFKQLVASYAAIDAHYSNFERNCFLRWLAFKELLAASNPQQFWHLDSDIIMHTALDALAKDTEGKTFILQGGPAFVSIANQTWFDAYERHLKLLNADIVQYSNDAFEQKAACKLRDRELVNSSSYRNPIGSDQDLLEFLVSSEQIPQSSKAIIFDSRFYFIENALCLDEWHRDQIGSRRGRFIADDVNGVIQIANKSVPFTHFQSDFTRYAAAYLAASDLFIPNWVLRRILRYTITDEGVWPNRGFSAFSRIGRRDRDNVVRRFTDSPSRMAAMLDFLFAARKPHLKRSAPNKVQREVVVAK